MTKRLLRIAMLLIFVSIPCHGSESEDLFSHLQPKHRSVLKRWLANRPSLRIATEEDCKDKEGLAYLRREVKAKVHPYYSVGDFNLDGKKDFAVILFVIGKDEAALAVFNAPFSEARPAYFERGFEQHPSLYLVYDYMAPRRLYLGVFEGDYYCMTLIPRGRKYGYEDCER